VQSVTLSDDILSKEKTTALLDSGTTDTYLMKDFGDKFKSKFLAATGLEYEAGKAYKLTPQQLVSLPSLHFYFEGGSILEMEPEKYMDLEAKDAYVPRVYFTEHSYSILGSNVLSGHDISFDLKAGRVGFAKAWCGFNPSHSIDHCNCLDPPSPVCGRDGSTYVSQCYADCMGVETLWDRECPSAIPHDCRSILFSHATGCLDIAQTFLAANGR